jgi:hypothetical protein
MIAFTNGTPTKEKVEKSPCEQKKGDILDNTNYCIVI